MSVAKSFLNSVTHEERPVEVELPHEVLTVQPQEGGLPRKIVQTGTIEAIETVELQVRVSGYVKNIAFDIGDSVEAGQVVAEIDAGEYLKDVEKQAALLELAESRVSQAIARVKTSQADRDAAQGAVQRSKTEVVRTQARLAFHEQELQRIETLVAEKAIEVKLAAEKEFELEAAKADLENAKADELVAEAKFVSIESGIERSEADVAAAQAEVRVARADLARAKVMASYLSIVSPFTGVVTARNFDRGDYVHAASAASQKPLLTIARNDRMRAVLQVPAPDVPYVKPGQTAAVSVSSLGGKTFEGIISRVARNQDVRTRTMRVEVDLDNTNRELAGGMYGAVSVEVPAPTNELSLPVACLVGRALNGVARVYSFESGTLKLKQIGVGRRYGDRIEIIEGLAHSDWIVSNETIDFSSLREGHLATMANERLDQAAEDSTSDQKLHPAAPILAKPALLTN